MPVPVDVALGLELELAASLDPRTNCVADEASGFVCVTVIVALPDVKTVVFPAAPPVTEEAEADAEVLAHVAV